MRTHAQLRRLAAGLAAGLAALGILASIQLTPLVAVAADTPGGLAVAAVDPAGTSLVGTCFELYTDAGGGTLGKLVVDGKRCDKARRADGKAGPEDGLLDGVTAWSNLAPGAFVLHEVLGPALAGTAATYEVGPDTAVSISAGAVTSLRLVHRPQPGLTLHKVDATGRALPGACFSLSALDRAAVAACDGPRPQGSVPAGDGLADGLLVFTALAPTGKPTRYTL
ncbi:MAG TPA: hypothetical protein VIF63_02075, partial [Candidatus Limnocylindrales bacterium]